MIRNLLFTYYHVIAKYFLYGFWVVLLMDFSTIVCGKRN